MTSSELLSWRWPCAGRANWMTKSLDEPDGPSLRGKHRQDHTKSRLMEFQFVGSRLAIRETSHLSHTRYLQLVQSVVGELPEVSTSTSQSMCDSCLVEHLDPPSTLGSDFRMIFLTSALEQRTPPAIHATTGLP